jgi:hypothetical protein
VQRHVPADLEVGDTAGLETCATRRFMEMAGASADVILASMMSWLHPKNPVSRHVTR